MKNIVKIIFGFIIGYAGFLVFVGSAYATTYTLTAENNGTGSYLYQNQAETGGSEIPDGTYYVDYPFSVPLNTCLLDWKGSGAEGYCIPGTSINPEIFGASGVYGLVTSTETITINGFTFGTGLVFYSGSSSGGNLNSYGNGSDVILSTTAPVPSPVSVVFTFPTSTALQLPFNYFTTTVLNSTSGDQYALNFDETELDPLGAGTVFRHYLEYGTAFNASGTQLSYYGKFDFDDRNADPATCVNYGDCNYPWSVTATLYDLTMCNGFGVSASNSSCAVASSTVSFVQEPPDVGFNGQYDLNIISPSSTNPSGTPVASTTNVTGGANNYSTSTPTNGSIFGCVAPNNILDIGGGIYFAGCGLIQLLFNPAVIPYSQTFFNDSLSNSIGTGIEQVPPMSAFFSVASSTIQGLQNASTSTSTPLVISGVGLDGHTMVPLVTLGPGILYQGSSTSTAQSVINTDMVYINAWLWIAALLKILGVWIFRTNPQFEAT